VSLMKEMLDTPQLPKYFAAHHKSPFKIPIPADGVAQHDAAVAGLGEGGL